MEQIEGEDKGEDALTERQDETERSVREDDMQATRCGPRGAEWKEDQAVFPCPCCLSIQRSRFARHVRDCPIQPCPTAEIKGSFKEVVALVREGADRRVTCFCGKVVKTSEKDVNVAQSPRSALYQPPP